MVLERIKIFFGRHLFALCCVTAGLSMLAYIAAFSCELAWLLETGGHLHIASYLLCVLYFILFIASFILIHGLVTSTLMELISWSCLIAILSIPELIFVVHTLTEQWGIQSVHGLTELIGYLIRLFINVIGLLCVIILSIRWRNENQLLLTKILIDPTQSHSQQQYCSSKKSFDNFAFNAVECPPLPPPDNGVHQLYASSKNEFNASAFGLHVEHQPSNPQYGMMVPSRSHSMHDLRMARQPPQYQLFNAIENPMMLQKLSNNKYDHNIYHTINFKPKTYNKQNLMKRNCISMENLKMTNNSLRKVKTSGNKDGYLNISNPQLTNISSQYYHMPFGFIYDLPYKKQNSKQSLATTNGSDDYLKYRDVAL